MKDNVILANFDMLVDLDYAMFQYFRDNFYNSDYVDKAFLSQEDEHDVKLQLLSRQHINPLEVFIPNEDPNGLVDLYNEILETKMEDLLGYAKAYDTFPLLITFLNNASSVDIIARCDSELQSKFISKLNDRIKTITIPRNEVKLKDYTVFWEKYFSYVALYNNIEGKHIYIANAQYNMEPGLPCVNLSLGQLYGDVNLIHMMDLYTDIKYIPPQEDETNGD